MIIGSKDPPHKIMLNNNEITSSNEKKLEGILLGSKLNFLSHASSLCWKADQKLNAVARLKYYLKSDQITLILNSVIKSQFTYCPLIWMFTSYYRNNALNNIHERALNWTVRIMRNRLMGRPKRSFSYQNKIFTISKSFKNFPHQLKTLWNFL